MFTIYNHKKDILEVDYQNQKNLTQDKCNHLNLMHMKLLLGTNHRLPLSYMAKIYIWTEETKELIDDFSIGYMINPTLNIKKSFKEQVTKCMKTTFGAITQPYISKILSKKIQEC